MANGDKVAAHELALFIINDADLYRQQGEPIIKNLRRKIAKGIYNAELAVKLWRYLADSGAKKYTFMFGEDYPRSQNWQSVKGYGVFSVPTRLEVARELRDHYASEVGAIANPRRRAKKRRRSERGFFPRVSVEMRRAAHMRGTSRGGRRGAHEVIYRSIRSKRKNPVKRLTAGKGFDASDAVTPSGKVIPSVNSSVYQDRVRRPKWNVKVGPLMDAGEGGRLLRQRLPDWTAADHEYAARFYDKASREEKNEWGKLLDRTHLQTFGVARQLTDYKISGIGRDEYPEKAKAKLRALAHLSSAHGDAASAHWRAAGKRKRMNPARRNPATHIRAHFDKFAPRAKEKLRARLQSERARRRRLAGHLGTMRLPGGETATARDVSRKDPFAVQVKRGKAWITLGTFPYKASATDYGRALKHRYPSKSFRVFW